MQEYCISDRAKRQKLEEMNEQRKSRNNERSHQKPWHSDQSKQKTVNSVSEEESRETRHHKNKSGRDHCEDRSSRKDRSSREDRSSRDDRSSREDRYNREDRYQKGRREKGGRREKTPFCYFHGKDQGHWTNECPIAIETKAELERKNAQSAKPVNYTSQPPHPVPLPQTTWTPTPNWPVSYPVYNYNPSYTPPMSLPSQQSMRYLRTSRCRCYPLRSTPTHGQGAPRLYPHHRRSSQDRYRKEQATDHPAAWLTSSTPSPEDPMNRFMRRRGNTKNTSELSLM